MELMIIGVTCLALGIVIGIIIAVNLRKELLSIITYPYKEEHGSDGIFSDDRRAEIGYKFQLFVHGIPCFNAHKVPIQILEKKQVTLHKIEEATKSITHIIENMASLHPAIKAYRAESDAISATTRLLAKSKTPSRQKN